MLHCVPHLNFHVHVHADVYTHIQVVLPKNDSTKAGISQVIEAVEDPVKTRTLVGCDGGAAVECHISYNTHLQLEKIYLGRSLSKEGVRKTNLHSQINSERVA